MKALAGAHDAAVQMIDTSIVRVHQHGACITRNRARSMGRSRGGLTSKIHALVEVCMQAATKPSAESRPSLAQLADFIQSCRPHEPRESGVFAAPGSLPS